jgi:hypothetical protein
MRIEIFIFLATAFFIYNSYHDGKYTKMLVSYKKYYQMAFYVVLGLGVYLTLKRSPTQGKNMLVCANNVVKYMPIDKSSLELLSPIFDLTGSGFMDEGPRFARGGGMGQNSMGGGQNAMGGVQKVNRSVSGMKKKYVASQQDWKCGECRKQLDYTYEVDHKIRLEHGGGNDVQNLIALCRECHGKKTVLETF